MKAVPSKCERCGKMFQRTKSSQHATAYTCPPCLTELDATPVPVSMYADDSDYSFASGAFRKRIPLSDLVPGHRLNLAAKTKKLRNFKP